MILSTEMNDIEMNVLRARKRTTMNGGFAAVADFVASDPDNELFVFRKFNSLAARNLLNMQNELKCLERQQEDLDHEVTLSSDDMLCSAARNYDDFKENLESHIGIQKRKHLQDEIARMLDKYCMLSSLVYRSRIVADTDEITLYFNNVSWPDSSDQHLLR